MTARPDPRVGSDLGPYRIERVIGRGGMGVVYLATHAGLQRRVALKLLAPDYADDEAFRARFLRESRMAAAIDHPNIIPIYEAGEVDGVYFLAMRFVEGTDLETRLKDGPIEPRHAAHVLAQVASALDAAHAAGLVHRDVKPANILVASGQGTDGADHAYLTDFGLTKQRDAESGLTREGSFLGTVDYVAPEQIEGKPVDGRADQYALACLAFHTLAGEVPFPRDADLAVINAHLRDAPPSLRERRPGLPVAADAVLARAMAKQPADRYPGCRAFVDDLRAALGVTDPDLHARPASTSRRPALLAAGFGVLLVVAILAVALGSGILTGGPAATASPGSAAAAAASAATPATPSDAPSASALAYGEPTEPFPSAAEQALLAELKGVSNGLGETCSRGPYREVTGSSEGAIPIASLACKPDVSTGASEVIVRKLRPEKVKTRFASNFITMLASGGGSYFYHWHGHLGPRPITGQIGAGDCANSAAAVGTWSVAGEERGAVICYVDDQTGDALMYWADDLEALLVRARNARGDSAALYDFFEHTAKYIAP